MRIATGLTPLAMTVGIDGWSFCFGMAVTETGRQFFELTGRVNAPPLQFFFFAILLQTKLFLPRKTCKLHELFIFPNICLHPIFIVL
jgi:hypothetical protein